MAEHTDGELQAQLHQMTAKAAFFEQRAADLESELGRVREWRQAGFMSVVAVALLAILMLGIVAFNAVD